MCVWERAYQWLLYKYLIVARWPAWLITLENLRHQVNDVGDSRIIPNDY